MNKTVDLIITKATICKNLEFLKYIIEKADIKPGDKVAIAYWSTPFVYNLVKKLYPGADVYFIDEWGVPTGHIDSAKIFRTNVNNEEYWPDMKFDKIIMNPPYGGRSLLYLKILEKVVNYIEPSGKIINLSPITFLDKHTLNKPMSKFRDTFNGKIINISEISHNDANAYFKTGNSIEKLGLYEFKESSTEAINLLEYGFTSDTEYNLYLKVSKYREENKGVITFASCQCDNKYGCQSGKQKDGRDSIRKEFDVPVYTWHTGCNCREAVVNDKKEKVSLVLYFNSASERENFFSSLDTKFMNWYYRSFIVPGDGKLMNYMFRMRDYTQPWTNQRFCEYFGITGFISDTEAEPGSEWETIINTMKEYE